MLQLPIVKINVYKFMKAIVSYVLDWTDPFLSEL